MDRFTADASSKASYAIRVQVSSTKAASKDTAMTNDAAFYADQSDPARNRHFLRRWDEPPFTAAALDRVADHMLQHGLARAAERLSQRAAHMREAGR